MRESREKILYLTRFVFLAVFLSCSLLTRKGSTQDIAASTKIVPTELGRTLQSLACAKYKLLTKSPKGREVEPRDRFTFNSTFSCALAKIKLQTVANKVESNDEAKETDARVDESRINMCEVRLWHPP